MNCRLLQLPDLNCILVDTVKYELPSALADGFYNS